MPPRPLKDFKTIKIECKNGHRVAEYRKPKSEWGHRTHKLWLLRERIKDLAISPPILVFDEKEQDEVLDIPPNETKIFCANPECGLEIGDIQMVMGQVAIKLNERNLKPTKG